MGVDCTLITESGRIDLDRMYVFENAIEDGTEYNRSDFLLLIDHLLEEARKLPDDEREYCVHWLDVARKNAGERNTIISEHLEWSSKWKRLQ